jgi:hypothetical protein
LAAAARWPIVTGGGGGGVAAAWRRRGFFMQIFSLLSERFKQSFDC